MSTIWKCRDRVIEIGPRALVMGIVNITPDSFSDGGRHDSTEAAVNHALKLQADGADILDLGGESSRPGAEPVSVDEELRRVIPVVQALASRTTLPISVDTVKAEVARQALAAGASIINDISALRHDPAMIDVVRDYRAGIVLMHMQGNPQTMHLDPHYDGVVAEVGKFLEERLSFSRTHGLDETSLVLDPGIGFGKSVEHTWQQLRHLAEYQRFGRPVCLGVSRKGFIGVVTGRPRDQRAVGSVAVACHALACGAAQIVRVHDVAEHLDAVRVLECLTGADGE